MSYSEEDMDEFDRAARAYGWEVGRGHPLTEQITTSDDNPFMDPNWRKDIGNSTSSPEQSN